MSIERRVKPASRSKEERAQRIKPVAIILGGIAIVAVVAVIAISRIGGNSTIIPGIDNVSGGSAVDLEGQAVRAIAESAVSYRGTWYEDSEKEFQCYLPGGTEVEKEGVASVEIRTNEAGTAVYGVVVADTQMNTLGGDPSEDPLSVVNSVMGKVVADTSLVMYGAEFSDAVDISSFVLSDGTKALWVKGTLQTTIGMKSEGSDTVTEMTVDFPIQGFVSLRDGWPVFVWGVADPSDAATAASLSDIMHECAKIFSGVMK